MNPQNLGTGKYAEFSTLRQRAANAYEQLSGSATYQRNDNNLKVIHLAVIVVSAIATGFTNAFAHRDRIGDVAAFGLALLIVVFVERFYVILRDGLTTTYTSGKQRFYAQICYRVIQISMILNASILTCWIVGHPVPWWLEWWNFYSIVCHFSLALLGVQAVRDSDSAVENRMLELKAATARQDIVTLRKSSAFGSPLPLLAARIRGTFDALALSFRLLFTGDKFSKKFMEQIGQVAAEQYGHVDAVAASPPTTAAPVPVRRPGFASTPPPTPPKAPAPWI